MIEVRHLTKKYGAHLALDDVSFTVQDGQIYGLLGPNGAGKSTTMNMITGYLSPTEGTVTINGHDVLDEPKLARQDIGFLPEIPPLYPEMTVEEYLLFVAELKKTPKKQRTEQVEKAIKRTGLSQVTKRLIRNLSKGYRQRVGIAQALLGSPKVIILDEPTVGLDPAQVIEIRRLIRDLGKTHTVILSSHILSEVQAVCDQVLILSEGKLAASGAPEKLSDKLSEKGLLRITAIGSWEKIHKAVCAVKGVTDAKQEQAENGEITFVVHTRKDADLRAAISRALASADCAVLSMAQDSRSLEDVFLELTENSEKADTQTPGISAEDADASIDETDGKEG